MKKKVVCVISGPTASGKTDASLRLGRIYPNAEVVNFDSLLFYKELNIGTAKPSLRERREVPHRLVDISSICNPVNAADYAKLALKTIEELHQDDKIPLLTGGSGFYLQALLYGMFDSVTVDSRTRNRSDELYRKEGIGPFLEILRERDPVSFERYHGNDHYRIRRAVEHLWTHGTPFSEERRKMMAVRQERSNIVKFGWNVFHAHLDLPKAESYEIIKRRTSRMLSRGLVEEVQSLLDSGCTGREKPLQSIGYKETLQFLKGDLSKEELEERINISTRQLAKAQRTWFKKIEKNQYHPLVNADKMLQDFDDFLHAE